MLHVFFFTGLSPRTYYVAYNQNIFLIKLCINDALNCLAFWNMIDSKSNANT